MRIEIVFQMRVMNFFFWDEFSAIHGASIEVFFVIYYFCLYANEISNFALLIFFFFAKFRLKVDKFDHFCPLLL